MTKSCRLVLKALESSDKLLTAQEIYDWLRENQTGRPPGLTTVYRSLEQLIKNNTVSVINSQEGERRFSYAVEDSHLHHIICKHCYKSLPIEQCAVEKMALELANEHGFKLESHVVEFYGVCPSCLDTASTKNEKAKVLVTS